jgi:hypothetical protein
MPVQQLKPLAMQDKIEKLMRRRKKVEESRKVGPQIHTKRSETGMKA